METILETTGKFCIKCEYICYPYEQGLCCNCDNPWITEKIYEIDYPESWIDCNIKITHGN